MVKTDSGISCIPLGVILTPYGCLFLQFAETPECEDCYNPITIKPLYAEDFSVESVYEKGVLIIEEKEQPGLDRAKRKPRNWKDMTSAVRRAYMEAN